MNKRISAFLICILFILTLSGCESRISGGIAPTSVEQESFEIRMLDVGQGLSILIRSGDHYMLYDGGGRSRSSYVVAYMKEHKIASFDYVFVSHYDEDHLSGLLGILNTMPVEEIITPDYVADSAIYRSFEKMKEEKEVKEVHAHAGDTFDLGQATITVLSPKSYDYEKENNNSIVIKVEQNGFSCLLTGDAETEVEEELLSSGKDITADVYVVSHHGSSSSNSETFIEAVSPSYALISVGAENGYGHPTEATLRHLKEVGAAIYRTDFQGEVTLSHEDNELDVYTQNMVDQADLEKAPIVDENVWETGASEDMSVEEGSYGEEFDSSVREDQNQKEDYRYVINLNTKVFHEKGCPSIKKMKEKNKEETMEDRDSIIARGYRPCGNCHP